jgi:hypothetical protein
MMTAEEKRKNLRKKGNEEFGNEGKWIKERSGMC